MIDIINKKFNKLFVLKLADKKKRADSKRYRYYYLCKCDCGNEIIVEKSHLLNGHTKSCGCERKKPNQGQFKLKYKVNKDIYKRIYNIWRGIKTRCFNKNDSHYKDYGERGITICKDWLCFQNFYDWAMNNGYQDNLSIDRIDVNDSYYPQNCRWATNKTQNRNKRNNHLIYVKGIIAPVSEICEIFGVNKNIVFYRLKKGLSYKDLFE